MFSTKPHQNHELENETHYYNSKCNLVHTINNHTSWTGYKSINKQYIAIYKAKFNPKFSDLRYIM